MLSLFARRGSAAVIVILALLAAAIVYTIAFGSGVGNGESSIDVGQITTEP
jgi:hypothetical protein